MATLMAKTSLQIKSFANIFAIIIYIYNIDIAYRFFINFFYFLFEINSLFFIIDNIQSDLVNRLGIPVKLNGNGYYDFEPWTNTWRYFDPVK